MSIQAENEQRKERKRSVLHSDCPSGRRRGRKRHREEFRRTDVSTGDLDRHFSDLPRLRSLHLARRSLLHHRSFQRLPDHAPHSSRNLTRIPFPHRIPELSILVQPLTCLVQPEVRIADLERDLMQETEEDVCCCGVELRGSDRVCSSEGEEVGEERGGVGRVDVKEQLGEEVDGSVFEVGEVILCGAGEVF
jgi:hypothetical protein